MTLYFKKSKSIITNRVIGSSHKVVNHALKGKAAGSVVCRKAAVVSAVNMSCNVCLE